MARIQGFGLTEADEQKEADRQTASLAGLAVTLLIVVLSLFVMRQLAVKTAIEDCLLAGRSNCDIIIGRAR